MILCFYRPSWGCDSPHPHPQLRDLQGEAHLQHVGEVDGDALQQQAVWLQLGALPAGDVAVALAHQDPHLLHGGASVHVVAQRLVDSRLPVVETGQTESGCQGWGARRGLRSGVPASVTRR